MLRVKSGKITMYIVRRKRTDENAAIRYRVHLQKNDGDNSVAECDVEKIKVSKSGSKATTPEKNASSSSPPRSSVNRARDHIEDDDHGYDFAGTVIGTPKKRPEILHTDSGG